MKQDIPWWQIIALCILIAGIILTVWSAQQQDQTMRNDLLLKASIANSGISTGHVASLSGTAADITLPEYQALKAQLKKIRASDPAFRFAYLMGQQPDGTIFFYADSEPPESADYSPPGQIYDEAPAAIRSAFATGNRANEGPFTDRWGTWVSEFVPVVDPATGRVIAVFGMDTDAKNWNTLIIRASLPMLIATLLIVLLVFVSAFFQRRNDVEKHRLKISEEKFSKAFHANPALMAVSTLKEGRILDVNVSFLEAFGYSREEVIGKKISDLDLYFDPDQRNIILNMIRESGQIHNVEVTLYRKNRDLLYGSLTSITIDFANTQSLFTAILDITERKRDEIALAKKTEELMAANDELTAAGEELKAQFDALTISERMVRESEERVHTIINSMQFGIIIIDVKTHTILEANRKALEMIGTGEGAVSGSVCHRFICPAESGRCPVTDLGQTVDSSERVLLTMRGEKIPILKSVIKTMLGGKEVLIESFIDITESKRAEEALRESEEKFKGIFDSVNDGIHIHEIEQDGAPGKFIEVNEVACRMLGYSYDEMLEHGPLYFVTGYHSRPFEDIISELSSTGRSVFETEHRRKDGTIIPVEINAHVSSFKGEQVMVAVVRDITERKHAEQTLRKSEEKYRSIFNNFTDLYYLTDINGIITTLSPSVQKLSGWAPEELIGHSTNELYPFQEEKNNLMDTLLRTGEVKDYEVTLLHKNGNYIKTSVNCHVIYDDAKKPSAIEGTLRDITERKAAEEALKQLSDRLFLAARAGGVGIWDFDVVNNTLIWDKQMFALYGITREQFSGAYDAWQAGLHPDDRLQGDVEIQMALNGEKEFNTEFRVLWPDGSIHNIRALAIVQRDSDGKPLRMIGTNWDITEQKTAEEELRRSEEKFRLLIENIHDIIYTINMEGIFTFVSPSWTALLGHPVNKVEGESFQHFVHPDDLPACMAFLQKTNETAQRQTGIEYRVRHADGTWRFHTTNAVPLKDKSGTVIAFEGSASDITERKRAEEALLQASKKLAMLNSITRHDILNQLMGLRTYLELSKMDVSDPVSLNYIQKEDQAAEAIQWQIEFTKNYQDIGGQAPKWQNLSDTIGSAVSQLKPPGVEIKVAVNRAEIFADPLMEKVFYNLMENSLRHGEHVTRMGFSVKESDSALILTYADNGVGVTADDKKKLFVKGFGKHTGLGLFLSKEILSITGITISETGEPGKGVRFEMMVPKGAYRLGAVQ